MAIRAYPGSLLVEAAYEKHGIPWSKGDAIALPKLDN